MPKGKGYKGGMKKSGSIKKPYKASDKKGGMKKGKGYGKKGK